MSYHRVAMHLGMGFSLPFCLVLTVPLTQPVGGDVQAIYGAGGRLLFGRGLLISSD